ncbi:MAG: DUF4837 family protein [Alistipes putredinis]|nr:MAG: DUF4837 family protein [Alistipes putredinis]
MKKTTLLFAALATMFLFTGCSDKSSRQHKVQSQGAAYEVIVVCSGATWDGQAGDTLRSIMLRPVDMLNQKEPQFDVLRFSPDGFTGLTQRHRNILVLNVGEKYEEPSIRTVTDVYASPQLIVQIDAPSQAAMTALLDTSRNDIVRYFETAERLRDTENAVRFGEKAIDKVIGETFGISLNIPSGYKIRNAQQDFMWISYEMPTSSQGIIIYAYPYTGKQDFTEKNIIARRNEFVKRIPGPSEGSYMTTVEDAATIEYKKNKRHLVGRSPRVLGRGRRFHGRPVHQFLDAGHRQRQCHLSGFLRILAAAAQTELHACAGTHSLLLFAIGRIKTNKGRCDFSRSVFVFSPFSIRTMRRTFAGRLSGGGRGSTPYSPDCLTARLARCEANFCNC